MLIGSEVLFFSLSFFKRGENLGINSSNITFASLPGASLSFTSHGGWYTVSRFTYSIWAEKKHILGFICFLNKQHILKDGHLSFPEIARQRVSPFKTAPKLKYSWSVLCGLLPWSTKAGKGLVWKVSSLPVLRQNMLQQINYLRRSCWACYSLEAQALRSLCGEPVNVWE